MKFLDEVEIEAASGRGGDGVVHWRREKFVPRGGPDGGDGGRGGDVVFQATRDRNTLLHLRYASRLAAEPGKAGAGGLKTGASGRDLVVEVPVGTVVRDADTGAPRADLDRDGIVWVALRGGRGGRGNASYATSTNRAPTEHEPGEPGQEARFLLELKLLADVGLVGLPNAGKSTLISRISAARPRIADYPFTTLEPQLGVVRYGDPRDPSSFVVADIPGLVEGAHAGAGLGHRFLRHVERTRLLLHLVSLSSSDSPDPPERRFEVVDAELAAFDPALAARPQIVVLTKADTGTPEEAESVAARFRDLGHEVSVVSAVTGQGLDGLVNAVAHAISGLDRERGGSR